MQTRSVKSYIRAAKRTRGHRAACRLAPRFMRDCDTMRDPWFKYAVQCDLAAAEQMAGEHF